MDSSPRFSIFHEKLLQHQRGQNSRLARNADSFDALLAHLFESLFELISRSPTHPLGRIGWRPRNATPTAIDRVLDSSSALNTAADDEYDRQKQLFVVVEVRVGGGNTFPLVSLVHQEFLVIVRLIDESSPSPALFVSLSRVLVLAAGRPVRRRDSERLLPFMTGDIQVKSRNIHPDDCCCGSLPDWRPILNEQETHRHPRDMSKGESSLLAFQARTRSLRCPGFGERRHRGAGGRQRQPRQRRTRSSSEGKTARTWRQRKRALACERIRATSAFH